MSRAFPSSDLSSDNILDPNFAVDDSRPDVAEEPPNVRDLYERVSMEQRARQTFHDASGDIPNAEPLIHDQLLSTPTVVNTASGGR